MSDRLAGKSAIITGAASGIGAATARLFVAEGARVILADVQDEQGQLLADQLGANAEFRHVDVAQEADIAAVVDHAVTVHGALDIMFNNAGVMGALGPIDKTDLDHADATIAINLRGVLAGMKHAARVMKPQGSGVIISTSSPAGLMGGVGPNVYSAAKAAIIGLNNAVAAELKTQGVRCNVIVPGAVVSPMTASLVAGGADDIEGAEAALTRSSQMGHPIHPVDTAYGVLYLASDEAAFVTGVTLPVDGGMTGAGGSAPFGQGRYDDSQLLLEAGRSGT